MTHNLLELQNHREYRLLAYQQGTLEELFHYYTNYLAVDDIYPKSDQILLEKNKCITGHYFTKKSFYSNIIILLHILFVDRKGDNHYSRLINTQNKSLISIIKQELLLNNIPNKSISNYFTTYLLSKSNTTLENIEKKNQISIHIVTKEELMEMITPLSWLKIQIKKLYIRKLKI